MSKLKKVISLLFALIIVLNCMVVASAAENSNIGVSEVPPIVTESGIQPYSTSKPGRGWNLAKQGRYEFHGNSLMEPLYSNYYFTGVSAVTIYVKNLDDEEQLDIKLLKSQIGIDWSVYDLHVTPRGTAECRVTGLDPSRNYILKFYPTCVFEGYIEA